MTGHVTLSDRLARLGGADLDVLEAVPRQRKMFVAMAATLIMTASLAVLSMTFAMHDGVKVWLPAAVAIGLFWGLLILTLDRLLVMSMAAVSGTRTVLLMALPRLVLAALISLVVSTPLVLRVFESDVQARVYDDQLLASTQQASALAGTQEQQRLNDLDAQIEKDRAVLAGDLGTADAPPAVQQAQQEVDSLTSALSDAEAERDDARAAWQCELAGAGAGCHDASDREGSGPLAAAKKADFDGAQGQVDDLAARLQQARTALQQAQDASTSAQQAALTSAQDAARAQLPALVAERDRLAGELSDVAERGSAVTRNETGLLAQLRALSEVSAADGTLRLAHDAVVALFFAVEMLPVVAKLLLVLAPDNEYERALRAAERADDDGRDLDRDTARTIAAGKAHARLAIEQDMREREIAEGARVNEHVVSRWKDIMEVNLRAWDAQVRHSLEQHRPDDGPAPTPGAPAPSTPPAGGPAATGGATWHQRPVLGDAAFI